VFLNTSGFAVFPPPYRSRPADTSPGCTGAPSPFCKGSHLAGSLRSVLLTKSSDQGPSPVPAFQNHSLNPQFQRYPPSRFVPRILQEILKDPRKSEASAGVQDLNATQRARVEGLTPNAGVFGPLVSPLQCLFLAQGPP